MNRVIRETATRLELKEIIKEIEEEVVELQTISKGKDAVIENLKEEVSELKREFSELESKLKNGLSAGNGTAAGGNNKLEELRKKLEDEQHRVKSLEARLGSSNVNLMDNLEVLQMEKKEMAIKLEDMTLDLQKAQASVRELAGKLDVFTQNKDDLATVNTKLRATLEKCEDEVEELTKQLKAKENSYGEMRKKCEEAKREAERVANLNGQLKSEVSVQILNPDAAPSPSPFTLFLIASFTLIRSMNTEVNCRLLILVPVASVNGLHYCRRKRST